MSLPAPVGAAAAATLMLLLGLELLLSDMLEAEGTADTVFEVNAGQGREQGASAGAWFVKNEITRPHGRRYSAAAHVAVNR